MTGRFASLGLLAVLVAGQESRAQDSPWQQPEHLRGYVYRGYATDGTVPGIGKGPQQKQMQAQLTEKPKRETSLVPPAQMAVQPVAHLAPVAKLSTLPRMPHGFQDPTHPVGPAEPGCAAGNRFGPYIAGTSLPQR